MEEQDKYSTIKQGLIDGFPISLGYLPVAFTFGIMIADNNLPIWVGVLISMTNFTSAGQFAGTSLILSGEIYLEIAITTFIINIRYLLMSLSLSQKIDKQVSRLKRCILSFGITDEIFALTMQRPGIVNTRYLSGLMIIPYLSWVIGTFIGAASTSFFPPTLIDAFGIAIFAMFLAIIIPPSRTSKPVFLTVLISTIISCLVKWIPFFDPLSNGWVLIICAIVAPAVAAVRYPVNVGDEQQ